MYHIPLFRTNKPQHSETLEKMLRRYLTRKIGFEAVMRIRCTRGLSIHTFHGNFFVRSMDLLSLPNVNPDAGFGMQVSIEENLSDVQTVCFQAALLYTTSKGKLNAFLLQFANCIQNLILLSFGLLQESDVSGYIRCVCQYLRVCPTFFFPRINRPLSDFYPRWVSWIQLIEYFDFVNCIFPL